MPGRRWSDGLHQAVEAKEKVKIERENQTLATITFQNYFRMYGKLSGMTGTAETEAPSSTRYTSSRCWSSPPTGPHPGREPRRRLPDGAREVHRGRARDRGAAPVRRRRPRGHDLDREIGGAGGPPEEVRHPPRGAERQVPRAGGGDRGPGRPLRRVTIATNMAGRGTDIILGASPTIGPRPSSWDRRRTRRRPPPRSGRRRPEKVLGRMAASSGASSGSGSPRPRSGTPRPALLGLMASFAPDTRRSRGARHGPEGTPLAAYLDTARDLPARRRRRSEVVLPEIENPVDFLAVHPLKGRSRPSPRRRSSRGSSSCSTPTSASVWSPSRRPHPGQERHEARRIDNQLRGRAGARATPARHASTSRCRTT